MVGGGEAVKQGGPRMLCTLTHVMAHTCTRTHAGNGLCDGPVDAGKVDGIVQGLVAKGEREGAKACGGGRGNMHV